jgi:hypothetical protein
MSYRAGVERSAEQEPHVWGCDRVVRLGRATEVDPLCALSGSDPLRGPSSALQRAPRSGDASKANAANRRLAAWLSARWFGGGVHG